MRWLVLLTVTMATGCSPDWLTNHNSMQLRHCIYEHAPLCADDQTFEQFDQCMKELC